MKAHTVFAGTEAHTAHVVCGLQTNNSLHQKHLRKQEELSVRKRLFTVPINHLRAHVHKQTDARHRKQETGHPPQPQQRGGAATAPRPPPKPGRRQCYRARETQRPEGSFLGCPFRLLQGTTDKHSPRGCGQILALPQKRDPETDRISSPGHGVICAGPRLLMLGDPSSGTDLPSFLELIRWPPDTEA